jgi:hypothetical protein
MAAREHRSPRWLTASSPRTSPGLRPRRISAVAFSLAFALFTIARAAGAAGIVDPLLRFQQLRTEHFVIYFHQGEAALAGRLAALVEGVRGQVGAALRTVPPRRTHVILADQSEIANGWATPLPRNTVLLNAAAPSGADLIGRTDDWLRLVFTHEYVHIVHLDRAGGWARVARALFGRTPVAFPNLWLPQWQIEGLATWEESALTGGGRLRAGDFRAVEQFAAAGPRPWTLDRASGGLVAWPDGHAAYAAGLGFHAYLADRFGEASLGELATRTSRRLPFLGTGAYRRVFGEPLGTLWRDYTSQIATPRGDIPAQVAPRRLTQHGHIVVAPRFAPARCDRCPSEIVYSVQDPHGFPSLRVVGAGGGPDVQLTTRYLGSTIGINSEVIVFDQHELRRNVGIYSDLFVLERRTGNVQALTSEARLQDPDLSPDSQSIVAVQEQGGRRDLVLVQASLAGTALPHLDLRTVRVLATGPDTQFSAPRWSPDGRLIAAERRRLGAFPDVVIVDVATGAVMGVLAHADTRVVTPAWRPDGQAIVAAADFDRQPFDLYEFDLDGEAARRLTWTGGAFWPDVSPDGTAIVYAGYLETGYDVFTVPYALPNRADARTLVPPPVSADLVSASERDAEERNVETRAERYSPFGTLGPTTWTPLLLADAEQTRLGGSVGGTDVLGRHGYVVNLSWLVDGPQVPRPVAPAQPDWRAAYVYTRWQPSLFGSIANETFFREVNEPTLTYSGPIAAVERELQAGVFVPLVRVRRNTQALASMVRTDTRYRLPDGDRTSTIVSSRIALAHDTSRRYGYSVSREHGVNVGTTLELSRRGFGSRADATTATLDGRAYLPGIARHHVVALRAAGGLSNGSTSGRQSFRLGGIAASPAVIDFGGDALGLMRGGLGGNTHGDHLVVGNAEYRLPLAVIERGHGTWPLFLRTIHGSVFADAGQVRAEDRAGEGWTRAFGGELSVDVVAGYALPMTATVGVGWAQQGRSMTGTRVYARFGHAF